MACALLASWIAPYDPTDLASFELINAELPPDFTADGDPSFLLGTDNQGRDLLSAMLYGARVSIAIGGDWRPLHRCSTPIIDDHDLEPVGGIVESSQAFDARGERARPIERRHDHGAGGETGHRRSG